MFRPANLVKVFPIGFLIKWDIIKTIPVVNSDIATKLARNGDNPKYSISPSGGKGNLPIPYKMNAIPTPNLKERDPNASKFEKKLLNLDIILII
tara:strand:- start:189 stop:470 length:282 start_codon:yes stop_codon:yes gene_type:complete